MTQLEAQQQAEPLSIDEIRRRAELEPIVDRAMRSFAEAGAALAEIRTNRLYRDHGSFEAYIDAKWSINARYAHYLIAAAHVAETIPVGSERVARALNSASHEPAEVWERAVRNAGGDPTHVNGTHVREADRQLDGEEPSGPEPQTESEFDAEVRILRDICDRIVGPLREGRNVARDEIPATVLAKLFNKGRWFIMLKEVGDHVMREVRPYATCGHCDAEGCEACNGRGWVSQDRHESDKKHQGRVIE